MADQEFCRTCGEPNAPDAEFCAKCGVAIVSAATPIVISPHPPPAETKEVEHREEESAESPSATAPSPPPPLNATQASQPAPAAVYVPTDRKNPGVAAVLSFFWAGLGQIYNGQIAKGIGFMVLYAFCVLLIFALIGFILVPIVWIIGIVDAYNTAKQYNEKQLRGLIFAVTGKKLLVGGVLLILLIAVYGTALYAYSGSTPPFVAVESAGMGPHINTGDVVFLKALPNYTQGIVTYKEGKAMNYVRFGNYGDVIVYRPNGDSSATPIIHRAIDWVNAGDKLPDGEKAVHAGYITKGDANSEADQPMLFGGMPRVEPVKPEWIIGVAHQPAIPWIGNPRLALPTITNPVTYCSEMSYGTMSFGALIFNLSHCPWLCQNTRSYEVAMMSDGPSHSITMYTCSQALSSIISSSLPPTTS